MAGWVVGVVGRGGRGKGRCPVTERAPETREIVAAKVVVLRQDTHLRVGFRRENVSGVDLAFRCIMRSPAHGPRIMLGVVEDRSTRADEEMRHSFLVDVF